MLVPTVSIAQVSPVGWRRPPLPCNTVSTATDAPVNDEAMIAILRGVMDPELGDNIVDLGMVRNAYREGTTGHVTVALTTAGCPLRATIKRDCETRVAGLAGIENVRLHWDELNAAEKARVMERARRTARESAAPTQVPASARVLAVASGKGGVGKSSVTVNLAAALAARGFVVGVLDADIWGFSIPRMLGLEGRLGARPPAEGEERGKIVPDELAAGDGMLKVVSTGLLVETEETALMWRGLMLAKAVEQFLHDVDWGELDYLLIDMPPGTGDVQMALARLLPQAEMLVVTTPALSAQKVAVRVADMARRSHMPIVGVVENMGAFVSARRPAVGVLRRGRRGTSRRRSRRAAAGLGPARASGVRRRRFRRARDRQPRRRSCR